MRLVGVAQSASEVVPSRRKRTHLGQGGWVARVQAQRCGKNAARPRVIGGVARLAHLLEIGAPQEAVAARVAGVRADKTLVRADLRVRRRAGKRGGALAARGGRRIGRAPVDEHERDQRREEHRGDGQKLEEKWVSRKCHGVSREP